MNDSTTPGRREFLATTAGALGGGWLLALLPGLSALAACARESAERGDALATLSGLEGETMAAFAARILPSDDLPGAAEAGAVHFIDAALAGPFAAMLPAIREGVADLDARAATGGASRFAALPVDGQVAVMKQVENTPFFFNARMLTIMGVLSNPSYGGNRDGIGFELVRREHADSWQPPFGYYDAQATGPVGGAS